MPQLNRNREDREKKLFKFAESVRACMLAYELIERLNVKTARLRTSHTQSLKVRFAYNTLLQAPVRTAITITCYSFIKLPLSSNVNPSAVTGFSMCSCWWHVAHNASRLFQFSVILGSFIFDGVI